MKEDLDQIALPIERAVQPMLLVRGQAAPRRQSSRVAGPASA
jgi:hypothetical protein